MDEATNFYPSQTILTTTAYLIKNLEDSSYKEVLMRSDSPLRSCKVTQAIRAGLIAHRLVCSVCYGTATPSKIGYHPCSYTKA